MSDDELRKTYEALSTRELINDIRVLADMHAQNIDLGSEKLLDRIGHSAGVGMVVLTNRHPAIADELDDIWQHAEATDSPRPALVDALTQAVDASGVLADEPDDDLPYCDDGRTCGCPNPRED